LSVDSSGAGRQFLPHDGVPGVAEGLFVGAVCRFGQHRVDDCEGDRAALQQAERLEIIDDVVGTLPGDVGGDLVAGRVERRLPMRDDVGHTRPVFQDTDQLVTQFDRADHPQMQHTRENTSPRMR